MPIDDSRFANLLNAAKLGKNWQHLPMVTSTSEIALTLAAQGAPHGTLVIADAQSAGRGRRGRTWQSPAGGGLYFSLVLSEEGFLGPHIMQIASLSVIAALEECGVQAAIKWPNDIVLNGKKIVGMLAEGKLLGGKQLLVLGVGINTAQGEADFDKTQAPHATSLRIETGRMVEEAALLCHFLSAMELYGQLYEAQPAALRERYAQKIITLGRQVQVLPATGESYAAKAIAIAEGGGLIVERCDGTRLTLMEGDVSVRGIMGYV